MKLLTTKEAADVLHITPATLLRTIVAPRLVRIFRRNRRVILIHEDSLADYVNRRSK